jgi:hypothetical protein
MEDSALSLFGILGLVDAAPKPPALYHYTSMEAFISILNSGQIRATHIRYLNDLSEAEWMWQAVLELLQKQTVTEAKDRADRAAGIIAAIDQRHQQNEFVASFSENGDDLTQWRAYCPGGAGLSIGFNTAALSTQWVADPKCQDPAFVGSALRKVRYLNEQGEAKLFNELDSMVRLSPSIQRGIDGQPVTTEQFVTAWLSTVATAYKHPAFAAESEWRLVFSKPHKPMPYQRFRPGKSSLVPYIEAILNLDTQSRRSVSYMIDRVVIGPTPSPRLAEEALKAAFASFGHPEVQVEVSKIPFRHW